MAHPPTSCADAEGVEPELRISISACEIRFDNNEVGFSEQNVKALCNVSKSTKKGPPPHPPSALCSQLFRDRIANRTKSLRRVRRLSLGIALQHEPKDR